ncbi:MAG: hypothetical protein MK364_01260, partial [Pirellulales bacterium]|nr:hypothetical protein [Pirellulales bacterium]
MHSTRSAAGESDLRFTPRRSGNVTALLLIAMVVIAALLGVLWLTFGSSGTEEGETPIFQKVVRES